MKGKINKTLQNWLPVGLVLFGILLLASNAKANIIDKGNNTAEWTTQGINISFNGVANELCRVDIPASCSLFDVGKNIYNPNANYLSLDLLDLLRVELITSPIFTITTKNSEVWQKCDPTNPDHFCSPFAPTKPTYNLITGLTNSAVSGSSFLNSVTNDGAITAPAVPVPASVWLFGSGLLGLVGVAKRKA